MKADKDIRANLKAVSSNSIREKSSTVPQENSSTGVKKAMLDFSKSSKQDLLSTYLNKLPDLSTGDTIKPENLMHCLDQIALDDSGPKSQNKNISAEPEFLQNKVGNLFNTTDFQISNESARFAAGEKTYWKNIKKDIQKDSSNNLIKNNSTIFAFESGKVDESTQESLTQWQSGENNHFEMETIKSPGSLLTTAKLFDKTSLVPDNKMLLHSGNLENKNNIDSSKLDNFSKVAVKGFSADIDPKTMTREEMENLFMWYAKDISLNQSKAWEQMNNMFAHALPFAFKPDTSMDKYSIAAVDGFAFSIKPEEMTRTDMENLFLCFAKDISSNLPQAWEKMNGILNKALPEALVVDTSMDEPSRSALEGFQLAIKPEYMTKEELEDLFLSFAREISINYPEAWARMDQTLNTAMPYAFKPDLSMDDSAKTAVDGFASAIKPEMMTREQLEDLFLGFAKEISINYPKAWAQLFGTLDKALPCAFVPDTSMDGASRSALEGFQLAIKPEYMTREELEELFLGFAREVSINFPEAWARMYETLNKALPHAFEPDLSMDDSAKTAVDGFASAIKPEMMTREELEGLFLGFAKEISINYPKAWAQLFGTLNKALPYAFVPDTSMDDSSRLAIDQFQLAIRPENMTRQELETLFLRFSREISINFPEAWSVMDNILNNALPYAFEPDLTIDENTKELVQDFELLINNRELTTKELNTIFTDYLNQIPMQFSTGLTNIQRAATVKEDEAQYKEKSDKKVEKDFELSEKEFKRISENVKSLNRRAELISKDLKCETDKDTIKDKKRRLRSIQRDKKALDATYKGSIWNIETNVKANDNIMDDYIHDICISFDKKDNKELFDIKSKTLTKWDMLRDLRRKEVLSTIYEVPQDELAESLYVVPKHILKKGLIQLPVEDMCRVLFNARFPEALLSAMPRKRAVELLPPPKEMLAVLMNLRQISGYKTGCDLIEDVVTKGLKVEKEQNPTRTKEEIIPFVKEQLIGKTPRNADALRPVQGKENPIQKAIKLITDRQPDLFQIAGMNQEKTGKKGKKEDMKLKYQKAESLNPKQLENLALETAEKFNKDDLRDTLAAKRGAPAQVLQFLELMKKVKDIPSAKMAVSVLSDNQAKIIAKATLSQLETKHLVAISLKYGKSSKEMVKQMPRYSIVGLIKALPKHFMIQGFKLLDKSLIIGMLRTRSSQTIARVASEMLPRDLIENITFKKKGDLTEN